MSNVEQLGTPFYGEVPVDNVLNGALAAKLESVIVIGRTDDGHLYMAFSEPDGAHVLWKLEEAKQALFQ
jgi:hypothetical protein